LFSRPLDANVKIWEKIKDARKSLICGALLRI
jgi:hypothetical protein